MKNKQIIISVVIIFVAFVGYKIISSSIQENKEKAVLQEKARLEELAKEPLNQCIENIDKETAAEIKQMREIYMPSKESYEFCLQPTGHGRIVDDLIASGKMTLEEYCKPPSVQEIEIEAQKIRDKGQTEKEECYKQYK
jgi:hypothetical protein